VPTYSEKDDGKRDYKKINYCLYCHRAFTSKISAHYMNIHADEERVRKALLFSKGSADRKKCLLELEHRGNFVHNSKVSIMIIV